MKTYKRHRYLLFPPLGGLRGALTLALLLLLFTACTHHSPRPAEEDLRMVYRTMPVRNQGSTQACWIYAYLTCIETERLRHYGDSIPLSALWLLRASAISQAQQCFLTRGAWDVSLRGVGPDAEQFMRDYGMVPQRSYTARDFASSAAERDIRQKMLIASRSGKTLDDALTLAEDALPKLSHAVKNGFYLYGMHYTPQEFARSLFYGIDMQWLTSFSHHAYNQPCVLEIPDNRRLHEFRNLPLDTLLSRVIASLAAGHPMFWEGTMSDDLRYEATISDASRESLHRLFHADPNAPVGTMDSTLYNNIYGIASQCDMRDMTIRRQHSYETGRTADQHAMAIVAIITDTNGTPLLVCQNSWGKSWGNHGICYMTIPDFLLYTIAVGVIK